MNWFEILVIAGIFINAIILVYIYNSIDYWLNKVIAGINEVQHKMKD